MSDVISYWASKGVAVGLQAPPVTLPSPHAPKPRRPSKPLLERFEAKVQKGEGCWTWLGARMANGYGAIGDVYKGGKYRISRAHRVAYELYRGRIPAKKLVCHSCDNPLCVNPDHLFIGTHSDNLLDAYRKGRKVSPFKPHPSMRYVRTKTL